MSRRACALPGRAQAACHAIVRTDIATVSVRLAATSNAAPSGYGPADLQSAYALTAAAATAGTGVTVAVIDAYDDPTAATDLAAYRSQWNLPPCASTGANPCFRKVNQRGGTSMPAANAGWAMETSLDLDMVSAICPNCSILLVEADSAFLDDLGTAVNLAVASGARYISNSYGGPEDSTSSTLDAAFFKHPGVVITASTGDSGYQGYLGGPGQTGNEYPSVSPWVVAVGGTTLLPAANARGWTESAWAGAGSGCSLYEPRPSWQSSALTGCSRRMVADISAVADPNDGVAVVYAGGWHQVGGTSASAPIVAAAYALAGAPAPGTWPGAYLYGNPVLNDAIGGSNANGGTCSPDPVLWCTAVAGYDGPTGLGSLNGTSALAAPSLPGAPQSVAGAPGNASVAVTWAAPASNGGATITGYDVSASPGGRTCSWASGPLTCSVTGLSNGTAYTFTVTAANAAGTGLASDPSSPVTPRTVPGTPPSVTATPGDAKATVAWTPPVSDGGSPITGYTATASPGGATCTWTSGPYSCDIGGLANGSAYTFTVAASNAAGTGLASLPSAPATPRTTPGQPIGVTAVPGNGSAAVTWSAPAFDGGSPVTGYTVTSTPGGHTCAWSSGPLECAVSGLTNGVSYAFTVAAVNAAGAGPASDASAPVVPTTVPGAPTAVLAVPDAPNPGAVSVTWAAPDPGGSPITGYAATAYAAGTGTALGGCTSTVPPDPAATHCTITGLGDGVAVVVRVSATNATGQGLPSAPSAAATTPILPRATVVGLPYWVIQPSLEVAWTASGGSNAIASYQVQVRRSPWNGSFGLPTLWKSGTSATSAAFAPAAGSTYCFSARAVDRSGYVGPWSPERCTTTPLDDRSLSRAGYWTSGTGSAYYQDTWSRSYAYGSRAVRTSVRAKALMLVATSCPTCGTVRVYLGSTLLRTISLYSATTIIRRVFTVASFSSVRAGTVTVKLSSSGHRVVIDGLGISTR